MIKKSSCIINKGDTITTDLLVSLWRASYLLSTFKHTCDTSHDPIYVHVIQTKKALHRGQRPHWQHSTHAKVSTISFLKELQLQSIDKTHLFLYHYRWFWLQQRPHNRLWIWPLQFYQWNHVFGVRPLQVGHT